MTTDRLTHDVAQVVAQFFGPNDTPEDVAKALVAPDGLFWPALHALGKDALWTARAAGTHWMAIRERALDHLRVMHDITGPLADACLAAGEVRP